MYVSEKIKSEDTEIIFNKLLNTIPIAIFLINKNIEIVFANSFAEQIFGYNQIQLIDKKIEMLIPERFKVNFAQHIDNYIILPKILSIGVDFDFFCTRIDGSEFPAEVDLVPIRIKSGFFVLASIIDVTERKLIENKLKSEKEKTADKFIIANSGAGIGVWELDVIHDNIIWRSLEHDQIFGYKNIQEKWNFEIFTSHIIEEDKKIVINCFENAINTCSKLNFSCRITRVDNKEIRWLSIQGSPKIKDGKAIIFSGIVRDITDIKNTEIALENSINQLSEFAHTVSHDLMNPFMKIEMLLPKIKEYMTNTSGPVESINEIEHYVKTGEKLIKDLLDYAQSSSLHLESVDLNKIVKSVIEDIDNTNKVKISVETLPKDIKADAVLIKQLIYNLISNAIKFQKDGTNEKLVNIGIKNDVFFIQDNGIGIDKNNISKIGTPFYRVCPKKYKGTGLGLSICKKIIEKHEGKIWFESKLGEGTTVFFTLWKK